MKLYIYNENCIMAGREVPENKIEDYEISGQDPDEAGDWTAFEGEPEELLRQADWFDEPRVECGRKTFPSQYGCRVANTIRAEVYRHYPELEPK